MATDVAPAAPNDSRAAASSVSESTRVVPAAPAPERGFRING